MIDEVPSSRMTAILQRHRLRIMSASVMVHDRYLEGCIDMFAGRVYMDEPSPGLLAFGKLMAA